MTVGGAFTLILKLLISLISSLLPLVVLVRDWRFHDRRTKVHHQITRVILVIWTIASLISVALVWQETYRSSKLDNKIEELISGKNELLAKSETAQKRLRELED